VSAAGSVNIAAIPSKTIKPPDNGLFGGGSTIVWIAKFQNSDEMIFLHVITLRQNILHNVPVHVGEAKTAPLIGVGQPFVLDAQQTQNGGL